jgi:2-dehydropantoate 2-reductase
MRICVYGAGAIGGYLAGYLARSGAEVSVVARGAHLDAIRARGLRVESPDTGFTTHPAASDNPADLGEQDAVLVTVKAPSLPSVAAGLVPLMGPNTQVAFITNGIPWWYFMGHGGPKDATRLPLLDPGDALWNTVGPDRVVGGIAWPASSVPGPGVVRLLAGFSRGTVFGAPDGQERPGITAIADAFRAAGLPVTISPKIRDLIWDKLAFNLSAGPMCVLTSSQVRATHEEAACVAASRRLIAEAQALIAAMGCTTSIEADKTVALNTTLAHRPSILQDLTAGRPMEIDALYSVPLEMARAAGVPMPTLELLVALIKVRAREAGLYPKAT